MSIGELSGKSDEMLGGGGEWYSLMTALCMLPWIRFENKILSGGLLGCISPCCDFKCQHASVVNSLKVMMKNHQMFGMMRTRMQSKQNTLTQVCHLV